MSSSSPKTRRRDTPPPTRARPADPTPAADSRGRRGRAGSVRAARRSRSRPGTVWAVVGVVAVAVLALFVIFQTSTARPGAPSAPAAARYQVGSPGVGAVAPDFTLTNVTAAPGSSPSVTLSGLRGRSVLLYFHEGLGCQPCWNQIRDLQRAQPQLAGAGIDQLLSITGGPPDLIAQKMRDDGLTSPALADPDLAASARYQANQYGMMGTTANGHSFVLVGPDGRIQWRADYGGAPNYTMYVPVEQLFADLAAGRRAS